MVKNGFRIGNRRVTYTDTSLGRELNVKFNLNNTRSTNQATTETSVTPVNNAYSLCRQSPINIISNLDTIVITPPDKFLVIQYKNDTALQATINKSHGHVHFETSENPDYITSYNGRDFKLLQYHFHIDSEHKINGDKFKAEVHFVHKDVEIDEYLVIAIFLDSNSDYDNVFDEAIYKTGITNKNTTVSIDMSKLSDVFSKDYFTYAGSLTTDPFSADVTWVIFKHPSGINSNKAGHASNAGTPRSVQHNINPAEVLCFNSGVV
jgi:carbonic anhydrase